MRPKFEVVAEELYPFYILRLEPLCQRDACAVADAIAYLRAFIAFAEANAAFLAATGREDELGWLAEWWEEAETTLARLEKD